MRDPKTEAQLGERTDHLMAEKWGASSDRYLARQWVDPREN